MRDNPMVMSDHDISYSYRHAKNQPQMIGILADLNGTTRGVMERKLRKLGLISQYPKDKRRRLDYEMLQRLYDDGLSDAEIAKAAGCGKSGVSSWRYREGLPGNYGRGAEEWNG